MSHQHSYAISVTMIHQITSILGPLLFLIYINDLGEIFQNLIPVLYADDSNLIATGNSLQEIETKANNEIPLLLDWLQANRLSLNIKKLK
jgi:hypothetical protein